MGHRLFCAERVHHDTRLSFQIPLRSFFLIVARFLAEPRCTSVPGSCGERLDDAGVCLGRMAIWVRSSWSLVYTLVDARQRYPDPGLVSRGWIDEWGFVVDLCGMVCIPPVPDCVFLLLEVRRALAMDSCGTCGWRMPPRTHARSSGADLRRVHAGNGGLRASGTETARRFREKCRHSDTAHLS